MIKGKAVTMDGEILAETISYGDRMDGQLPDNFAWAAADKMRKAFGMSREEANLSLVNVVTTIDDS